MITAIVIVVFLLFLPALIKLGILYLAYIDWALRFPVICSVRLFHRQAPPPRKTPIGFFDPECDPTGATAKRKK